MDIGNIMHIRNIVASQTSCDDVDRICGPFEWFILTGRCSAAFYKAYLKMTAKTKRKVSEVLISHNGMSDYRKIIVDVAKAMGV